MGEGARIKGRFRWLEPPSRMGALTVGDVLKAGDAAGHEKKVKEWAASAWDAWSPHHPTVRQWCCLVQDAQGTSAQ